MQNWAYIQQKPVNQALLRTRGFSPLSQTKKSHKSLTCSSSWRRERDSNPRRCDPQRFSRPPQSTTLPSLQWLFRCKDSTFYPIGKISTVFDAKIIFPRRGRELQAQGYLNLKDAGKRAIRNGVSRHIYGRRNRSVLSRTDANVSLM